MYLVHFKGPIASIEVDREKGQKLKAAWFEKPTSEQVVEIGEYAFRLSSIKAIEPVAARRSEEKRPEPQRPRTPEEEAEFQKFWVPFMEETRQMFAKKDVHKAVLKRSKLNEYKEKYGKEYEVPKGYTVEEDI